MRPVGNEPPPGAALQQRVAAKRLTQLKRLSGTAGSAASPPARECAAR